MLRAKALFPAGLLLLLAFTCADAHSAPLVIAAAGAAIGYGIGGTILAAQIGWAIGSMIGASFAPNKKVPGQLLSDLRVVGTEYGQAIPWVRGHPAVAGAFWWNTDRRPTAHTTTSGGKGGGGGVESTSYTYDMDVRLGLTANEIAGVSRVWADGKLVWTAYSGSDDASLAASGQTDLWTRMTVYTGAADQEADSTEQEGLLAEGAISAAADAPTYRGRGSVFIEGLQLGSSGRIPNLVFEVQTNYNDPCTTLAASVLPSSTTWANGCGYFPAVDLFLANNGGTVSAYSADGGATWQSGTGGTAGGNLIVANSVCAVCGPNGGIKRTTNGTTWADVSVSGLLSGTGKRPIAVLDDDSFVCVTANGAVTRVHISTDGSSGSWIQQASPPSGTGSGNIGMVCVGFAGRVVAIGGKDGTATSSAWYSNDDASTWTRFDLPTSLVWTEICWNGRYFLLFDWGTGTLLRSRTGLPDTWESLTLPATGQWYAAAALNSGAIWAHNVTVLTSVSYSEDDGESWTSISTPLSAAWRGMATDGQRIVVVSTSDTDAYYSCGYAEFDLNSVSVRRVVEDLCERAGLAESQIDASDLSDITREVRGLALSQVAPTRQALELLMSAYFFDLTVSDKLYFRPRGAAVAATIPYEDLGAWRGGGEPPEPLELSVANDLELPAQIAVSYANQDNDYQTDTQYSDRLVTSTAGSVAVVQMPLVLTPGEAKAIADTMLLDQKVASVSTRVALLGDYAALEPTDAVTLTAEDGSTFRMRLVRQTHGWPLIEFDAVLDDTSILSSQGITSADYTSSTSVAAPADTVLELLDIPILRDADDDAGFYAAAKGSETPWAGAALYKSADDVEYDAQETFTESAVIGECTTRLGDWTQGFRFDHENSVRVNVGSGELSSTTRAAALLDRSVNAAAIGSDETGWEVVQFLTATLVSADPNVYDLTGLLRGMRGTEWMMAGRHFAPGGSPAAGERFILLQTTGLRRIDMDASELGVSRYWKGVTLGRRLSTATAETFANGGVGLKPLSPVDLRVSVDAGGDETMTWKRRTRLADRFGGPLGDSVPLGEDSEAYEIDIVDPGSPDTVLRTLTASSQTVAYTAAQKTADFGSPQPAQVRRRIYQVSATVGRGYALEETV